MRKLLITAAAVVFVFVAAVAAILFSGNLLPLLGRLFGPDHDFDPARAGAAPDYASELAWAALPSKADEADLLSPEVRALRVWRVCCVCRRDCRPPC